MAAQSCVKDIQVRTKSDPGSNSLDPGMIQVRYLKHLLTIATLLFIFTLDNSYSLNARADYIRSPKLWPSLNYVLH